MTLPAIARTLHGYTLTATGQTYRRKRDALSHGLEALHRKRSDTYDEERLT